MSADSNSGVRLVDEFDVSIASRVPLSDEWLKSVGFRWDEWERSGGKHWTLWFGNLDDYSFSSFEDLGLELNHNDHGEDFWFCWLRSDCSHKYARFIHLRHVHTREDVINIIVGITGLPWNPANHLYGAIRRPKEAEYIRSTESRLDHRVMKQSKWAEHEKDESQARPTHDR